MAFTTIEQDELAVTSAAAALRPLTAAREALEQERATCFSLGGPAFESGENRRPSATEGDRARARVRLRAIDDELILALIAEQEGSAVLATAREVVRTKKKAANSEKQELVVARLNGALTAAARISEELAALEAEAQQLDGGALDPLAWFELAPGDTRLTRWREAVAKRFASLEVLT